MIKKFLNTELHKASVASIEIERTPNAITIIINSAKPGVIIGRQGAGIEELKKKLKQTFFASKKITVHISIVEVDRPMLNAKLVAAQLILPERREGTRHGERGTNPDRRLGVGLAACCSEQSYGVRIPSDRFCGSKGNGEQRKRGNEEDTAND